MARRVKGEGSVYQRASDGRWFYSVDLGGAGTGKARDRRTVSARTLRDLRPKMAALDEKVRAGIDADGSATLEWWLHWWLEEIAPTTAKSPTTRRTYRGYIDNWIVPHLGKHRLDRLKPDHIRALYRAMRIDGRSPATIRQVHAILAKALDMAERDGKILRNPAKPASPGVGEKGSHGKLTMDEARRVLTVLAGRPDRARWYAALLLGMRQGEVLGLPWDAIDEDAGLIYVRQSQIKTPEGLAIGPVKSKASRRNLPLLPEIAAALRDVERRGPLVWGPMDNKADWKAWQALLAAANVERRPLHAARAATASLLEEIGYPPKLIAEILGHAKAETTSSIYIHGDAERHAKALGDLTRALLEP